MGKAIKIGTRVKWNDPDDGICSGVGVVAKSNGYEIFLNMDDGGEVWALAEELEPLAEGE